LNEAVFGLYLVAQATLFLYLLGQGLYSISMYQKNREIFYNFIAFTLGVLITEIAFHAFLEIDDDNMGNYAKDLAVFFITAAVGIASLVGTFATYYLTSRKQEINEYVALQRKFDFNRLDTLLNVSNWIKSTLIAYMLFIFFSLFLLVCSYSETMLSFSILLGPICTGTFCYLVNNLIRLIREIFKG